MSQVKDVIDGIKHRIPDRTNIYPLLNRAVRLIAKRLFYHKSSWVRGALSVTVTADSSSASLPSDYWGLVEKPYVSTDTYPLQPVPNQETKLNYTDNSIPIYYEVLGSTIHLIPGTSSEVTINGQYWARPTELTAPGDTMPYNELFDDAIQEILLREIKGEDIQIVQSFINKSVDEIVPYTDKVAPRTVQDGFNYNGLANRGDI